MSNFKGPHTVCLVTRVPRTFVFRVLPKHRSSVLRSNVVVSRGMLSWFRQREYCSYPFSQGIGFIERYLLLCHNALTKWIHFICRLAHYNIVMKNVEQSCLCFESFWNYKFYVVLQQTFLLLSVVLLLPYLFPDAFSYSQAVRSTVKTCCRYF